MSHIRSALTLPLACLSLTSLIAAQRTDANEPAEAARSSSAREHYERVLRELVSDQEAPGENAQRARALGWLREYVQRGEFGLAPAGEWVRRPVFVDELGRRCAVAWLLHKAGEDELVAEIASRDNGVWVAELKEDARLTSFLDEHGLSLAEAVRIQLPGSNPPPDAWAPDSAPTGGSPTAPPPSGSEPSGTGPSGGPTRPAGVGSPGSVTPSAPTSAPSSPTSLASAEDADWVRWFEASRADHFQPNRLRLFSGPRSGADAEFPGQLMQELRERATPLFRADLEHPVAAVRSAAAIAYGRVAGPAAAEELAALLGDSSVLVRDTALLALGANGAEQSISLLSTIAATGSLPGERSEVGARARSFAIVGLGLARRAGQAGAELDQFVQSLVERARGGERDELREAALVYARLSRAGVLEDVIDATFEDRGATQAALSRAIELLARGSEPSQLGRLSDELVHRRLSRRRAAALALGDFRGPLALPVLQTAFEQEKEPVARGYVLGSIGRRGGVEARRFLLEVLDDARRTERPWIALALGLAADSEQNEAYCARLRSEHAAESNADARGAWSLALGLSGDIGSLPILVNELSSARATRRTYAALALGFLGGDEATSALRAAHALESDGLARTSMLQAIALQGDDADGALLLDELARLSSYQFQGLVALSLGVHGGSETLTGCLSALATDEHSAPARAAAHEAAGLMLARSPGLALAELARSADWSELPDWLPALFRFTL